MEREAELHSSNASKGVSFSEQRSLLRNLANPVLTHVNSASSSSHKRSKTRIARVSGDREHDALN